MKIVIAGSSGLVGTALLPALRSAGHQTLRLVRRVPAAPDEIRWDPTSGDLDPVRVEGVDAVINLAGENIAGGRWTARRREAILRSRVDATHTIVQAIGRTVLRRPTVLLNASAAGYYGDRGDELLTEASPAGRGFLADVCAEWERQADAASVHGLRVTRLRFGVVLSSRGGALAKMLPLFRLGLGGRLGSGTQWMSWIGIEDAVGAILHSLREERCSGPINVVSPGPVTNAQFTAVLGRVLRRPAILPAPVWALRLAFGQMADEALLASGRVVPDRLLATGYRFCHPDLESALRSA